MTDYVNYPFKLEAAFFSCVNCRRSPHVPDNWNIEFKGLVKVEDKNFPKIEVFLRFETVHKEPVSIEIEVVGIFTHIPDQPLPDRSIVLDFVNERALFMMWPYASQMILQVTAQMGMTPITVTTPYRYDFRPVLPPTEE